jgi:hypothetical protein
LSLAGPVFWEEVIRVLAFRGFSQIVRACVARRGLFDFVKRGYYIFLLLGIFFFFFFSWLIREYLCEGFDVAIDWANGRAAWWVKKKECWFKGAVTCWGLSTGIDSRGVHK